MNILIVEDEPLVARDLQLAVKRVHHETNVVGIISGVAAAKAWFQQNPLPDLILSDIQLSDGISFQIYEELNITCPIIFTTAYDAYAIRAFKLNSIDYLLKPIDQQQLARAFEKFANSGYRQLLTDQIALLLQDWKKPERKFKDRFLVHQRNVFVPIHEHDISFFQKDEIIYLHTIAGEKFITDYHALDELEEVLNPRHFFRVNRQNIIHIHSIAKIKTTHKGLTIQIKHTPAVELDISREKAQAFKKWMGE